MVELITTVYKTAETKSSTVALPSTNKDFFIGISLAISSSLFIGSSFILKKKGLIKLTTHHGSLRAASGGYGYLRETQWWAGVITMGLGELCNFTAYGFAPASVVTPLGALSVLVSALMAVYFLDEKLNRLGKIGCFLTISGSLVIIIHAPKDNDINTLLEFSRQLVAPEFLFFSFATIMAVFGLILFYGPRYGSKYVHIYVFICSLLGAFTVTGCKGLGTGLKEFFTGKHTFSIWLTFACAVTIVICIVIQMVYLNRALDIFSTPIVTTIYYVLFTICVLVSSGILLDEWKKLTFVDTIGCIAGFLITSCGLFLINCQKSSTSSNNNIHLNEDNECFLTNDQSDDFSSSLNDRCSIPSTSFSKQKIQSSSHPKSESYANLLDDDDQLSSYTKPSKESQ